MALDSADITTLSRLLDEALALAPDAREGWLVALSPEHQRHAPALRGMLDDAAALDIDPRLQSMPTLPADEAVAHAGDSVGPYRLLREIGRGGMGSVWLAERSDGAYKRQLALKLPRLAWGAGLAERMARERDIGALLEHPAIARLYDAGVDERGRPYLALEYIDGQPIDAWCEAQSLSTRERLRLFVQVARAVAYAHGRLVVHRDLKPSNVLVTPDGQAHLLDFGIAKLLTEAAKQETGLTQQQGRVLTPHYASPEQVAGEAITVQSDVYSLGVLLYELLTNTLPIAPKRSTLGAVEEAILQGDAPPASGRVKDKATARALRGEVDAILGKAMQREPARRYATADAMAQDIERHLNGETVSARPDSLAYRLRKGLRRNWLPASAAAAVLVAIVSGSAVAVVQAQRAAKSAERERVVKAFVSDVFRFGGRADARNTALRPASPQALVESGAQLIQQRFAGQPELQAELFEVVGGVFQDMGAYRLAADYRARRIETLSLLQVSPKERAQAALAHAEALFADGNYDDAELRARRARETAAGDAQVSLGASVLVARVHDARSRVAELEPALDEIERQLAQVGPAPTTERAWVLQLRAKQLGVLNHLEQAKPMFQQAIDTAVLAEGENSATAVDIRLNLARSLAQTADSALASQHYEAAVAVLRRMGGAHEIRAAFEAAKFAERRFLSNSGQLSRGQALAILNSSRAELMASQLPIPAVWVPQIDFWTGAIKMEGGDLSGLALMEVSAPAVRETLASLSDRMMLVTFLGHGMSLSGRHELADSLLREAKDLRRDIGQANHPYAAANYAYIATNLMRQGRYAEAEAVLDQAPHFESMRGCGIPGCHNRSLRWVRAQVRMASGDAAGTLEILAESAPGADESERRTRRYFRTQGEALCATRDTGAGLKVLKRQLDADEKTAEFPHEPNLARSRAVTGHCSLTTGDRASALRLATLSRAAFTAQPGVSPYFKAPLVKLERALGLRLPPV